MAPELRKRKRKCYNGPKDCPGYSNCVIAVAEATKAAPKKADKPATNGKRKGKDFLPSAFPQLIPNF